MKIMIVDDSMTMRRIISMNLKKAGHEEQLEADNGKEALEKLKAMPKGDRPDLILLDWNMPVMSGLELLQTLKQDADLKDIPVIMVTSESEKERVVTAIQNGATGYLVKPFTPESFEKQVTERLNAR